MTTPTSGNSTAETGLPPNYYTHKLANGLQLVGQRMPSLASVTFGIQVAAGLRDEPEERGGLTNLLSDMMFQGTETRDVRQLTDEFEAIGARRGAEAGTEFARYSAQIVGTRLEKALELFADILMHPTFPEAEFEQMRAIQLQEIRRRDDEPMRRIFDLVREKFYAGTSLGRRALGTKESVEELEPEHLLSFWSARYHAQGIAASPSPGTSIGRTSSRWSRNISAAGKAPRSPRRSRRRIHRTPSTSSCKTATRNTSAWPIPSQSTATPTTTPPR